MKIANRFGKRWTINECLQLQREYELLGWSIDTIAAKHQRTPNAIMFKLNEEKLADYNTLYKNYYSQKPNENKSVPCDSISSEEEADHDDEVEDEDYEEDDDDVEDEDYEEDDDDVEDDDDSYMMSKKTLYERVNNLEKKIDELTQLVLSQTKKTQKGSSWFS